MKSNVAIVGAGVSGLTCGTLFAEAKHRVTIFADETGQQTTSAAAAAIWFPYDAEPTEKVIPWALETYRAFQELSREPRSGVSIVELRQFSRAGEMEIPSWAHSLGARALREAGDVPARFVEGFAVTVPLIDTTIYLGYLAERFAAAGGEIHGGVRLSNLEQLDARFELIINCAGVGARELVRDLDLEPHRGQVAIMRKLDLPYAIACDEAPLMYAIPRANDCVFGGTNELSADRAIDPAATKRIVAECSRALGIAPPKISAERAGLRPFRKSGVRIEIARLADSRPVIHNYGHGGAGFTLSWACAREVLALANRLHARLPND